MSKKLEKSKHVSKPCYKACVPPCSRYITSGDTHALCVVCLGAEHAVSALKGADCPHCEHLPLRTLRSRKALFEEGAFTSIPRGSGPASTEVEQQLHSWGSQLDLLEGMETGDPLSASSPGRSIARSAGSEARSVVSSPRGTGSTLRISSSEEVDMKSVEEAPQSLQYEELLEVVTRVPAGAFHSFPISTLRCRDRGILHSQPACSSPLPTTTATLRGWMIAAIERCRGWNRRLPHLSSTDTRRLVSKRRHSNGSSPSAIQLTGLLGGSSHGRLPAPHKGKGKNRALPLALHPIESEGSPGPLVQVPPAGKPLQDTVLAAQTTPEASLERLVPLVDHLAAWKLLPNVSAWVLHTVERSYHIQFSAPPPPFNGVSPTLVGPEQGLAMEQEVATLLRKEAIKVVPPHDRESGIYSQYFIVPKKDGGLCPILDLRLLNRSVMRLTFKMLTIKQVVSQIRSEDCFVTIDLKDAYFHVSILSQHRKFLRFAFRGEAYQYQVLPFGLALSPCTFTKYVDAELGLRLNAKKKNHLSRRGVGFDHDAGTFVSIVARVKEGRSLTVKQLLGLMAAASNVIPFGLLYMRPLQWWLKTRGFSLRGNPLCMIKVMRRCLRALDMWRKPWFLSQGLVLGAPCRCLTLATDVSLTGWGVYPSNYYHLTSINHSQYLSNHIATP
ncbi:Transposon Ty3-I Gag-Pol polyprotein [Labeo rohita]|uniref:ribonuclease H n=1 Tax=Labeo rohita TaxID=84645 RepID=A0ABQ8MVQ0_LABRO|nr:Transposon Ty3-I Gag-Pol polyprotein [Labeo rohita]